MSNPGTRLALPAAATALLAAPAPAQDWPQFARGPDRLSAAPSLPSALGPVRWILSQDAAGSPITFTGQGGIAAAAGQIVAIGRSGGQARAYCADSQSGALLWASPVPGPIFDSWSTPAIDGRNGMVLVASASSLGALDLVSGAVLWQRPLGRNVVNASPLITSDLGQANRAFITDYDPFGSSGRLYCINLDPFDAAANPFQPGEIVWSVALGATSGNTPAYRTGIVYTASVADGLGGAAGQILAFPAGATATPAPLWTFTNTQDSGFFGGLSVHASPSGTFVFAASYALAGGQFAANLVKVSAADGSLAWSVPCNRTDATPIPLDDGRIILSTGVQGFGSAPSIELFRDDGPSATLLWDTAQATWNDLNQNAAMDPGEYLAVGGWTHQPIAAPGRLLAGAIPITAGSFGSCTDLYLLDLAHAPSDPGFILDHTTGMGSTPAAAGGGLYTVGAAGLYALGRPCYANCDGSTAAPVLNVNDFTCFLNRYAAGDPYANCDGSTIPPILNVNDFVCFANRFAGGCP